MQNRRPVILGINRTQDASICLMRGSHIQCAIQKERLSRSKHDWGKLGDFSQFYRKLDALNQPIDLIVECYSSDVEIDNINAYHQELREELTLAPGCSILQISHHLAHVYSTPAIHSVENAAVMVIDFMGSPAKHIIEQWPDKGTVAQDEVEVASFYTVREGQLNCMAKQMWNGKRDRPVGLGCFYFYLTQLLFPGEGNEGKVMGLAPYGDASRLALPRLRTCEHTVTIPDEWLDLLIAPSRYQYFSAGLGSFQECADLAAAGQHAFEAALQDIARWVTRRTGARSLCYAGGTALNCVANSKLLLEGIAEVQIPPAPHDGGTAVGCAVFGLQKLQGDRRPLIGRLTIWAPNRTSLTFPNNLKERA